MRYCKCSRQGADFYSQMDDSKSILKLWWTIRDIFIQIIPFTKTDKNGVYSSLTALFSTLFVNEFICIKTSGPSYKTRSKGACKKCSVPYHHHSTLCHFLQLKSNRKFLTSNNEVTFSFQNIITLTFVYAVPAFPADN